MKKVSINHPLVFNNIHEAKEFLLNYWKTIELIKDVTNPPELVSQILYQDVRSKIVDILREGIIDNSNSKEDNQKRRYVMNVQEIRSTLMEKFETQIKLPTIYFHLQKLQEHGYVQIVAIIKDSRHNISYYGRTAQLFLIKSFQKGKEFWDSLLKLINELNPELDKDRIKTLFEKYKQSEVDTYNYIHDWFKRNVEIISKTSIDILELYDFLCNIYHSKQEQSLVNIIFSNNIK